MNLPVNLVMAPYLEQKPAWPGEGRHILASFDQDSIVVYQAYNREIGGFAVAGQHFGGGFSFGRMTWIKTSFFWMMHRSGWGKKPGQEMVLAVRLKREFFDRLLEEAAPSGPDHGEEPPARAGGAKPRVRVQWDPDRTPRGGRLPRRAIQLGLRGGALRRYSRGALLEICDLTPFVASQRPLVKAGDLAGLVCPRQRVYLPGKERETDHA